MENSLHEYLTVSYVYNFVMYCASWNLFEKEHSCDRQEGLTPHH